MPKPRYWLLKSEPDVYSIDDLQRMGRDDWDGVRNYQARNFMQEMKVGDLALFYHSRAEPPAVVGICRISREAAPDLSAQDPKHKYHDPRATPENPIWMCVQVEYVEHLARPVTLPELKSEPGLAKMELTRKGSRLSVQPVRPREWEIVMRLARQPGVEAAASKSAPRADSGATARAGRKEGLRGALAQIAGTLARDTAEMVGAFAKEPARPKKASKKAAGKAKSGASAAKAADKPKPAAKAADKPKPAAKAADKPKPAGKAADKPKPAAKAADKKKPAAKAADKPKPAKAADKPKPGPKPSADGRARKPGKPGK